MQCLYLPQNFTEYPGDSLYIHKDTFFSFFFFQDFFFLSMFFVSHFQEKKMRYEIYLQTISETVIANAFSSGFYPLPTENVEMKLHRIYMYIYTHTHFYIYMHIYIFIYKGCMGEVEIMIFLLLGTDI